MTAACHVDEDEGDEVVPAADVKSYCHEVVDVASVSSADEGPQVVELSSAEEEESIKPRFSKDKPSLMSMRKRKQRDRRVGKAASQQLSTPTTKKHRVLAPESPDSVDSVSTTAPSANASYASSWGSIGNTSQSEIEQSLPNGLKFGHAAPVGCQSRGLPGDFAAPSCRFLSGVDGYCDRGVHVATQAMLAQHASRQAQMQQLAALNFDCRKQFWERSPLDTKVPPRVTADAGYWLKVQRTEFADFPMVDKPWIYVRARSVDQRVYLYNLKTGESRFPSDLVLGINAR
eukprot:gnl/TRDRNA2_/TRDRNA2_58229_c0_seq2.p1 gnl/TRDRNA2_/TRDRNA2_58229_c0~~gnl/TRDRNA2_/TRDRNA2_58229_c0_seq2.p1  ORF type:complete len:288 (-),score=51.24 gnl/TRDRNA2_/TRDRNA2_58229_c0_seq2:61-924(-)